MMPGNLAEALKAVAQAAGSARDPWWIIGSASLALHAIDPGPIGDIDLLMSGRDAAVLLKARHVPVAPGVPTSRFRSAVFGRWTASGLTIEVMAGFEARDAGPQDATHWRPVLPQTRERIVVGGEALFVPSRRELAALFRRFGRAKDIARAAVLDQPMPRSAGPNACGSSADNA
ncbi:hypothetical protein [uncultured Sphingomonas sp.]|uniref:hypothetical protein n=1 Tax=uncultured Sphingomonas sp. TaxID=158754 RepID=UPI0035CA2556